MSPRCRAFTLAVAAALTGCHSCVKVVPGRTDGGWCEQPGAWVHDDAGYHRVEGLEMQAGADLSWLTMPEGFCARWFGKVGNPRQLRFAPGGELFIASPTTGTTSSGASGRDAIVLMPDDDKDGLADEVVVWRSGLASTQGILFVDGGFYFQDGRKIMSEPYARGDRAPAGSTTEVADITLYESPLHWPKALDVAEDGTIYVSNGGDQGDACDPAKPFHGGILALDSSTAMGVRPIAKGLRNAIYVRCHHDGHNLCFANELARDYSADMGGREKLVLIREGDDWGYPCCATKDLAYDDICLACSAETLTMSASAAMCRADMTCSPKCDGVVPESASFFIGDTPFGLDFIDGQFPPPWDHRVYVAPHGAFGTWAGARVVAIAFDPATGLPFSGSNLPGIDAGAMVDFLQGWDNGQKDHGRPTDVTVAPDGRLFVSNDQTGDIIWIATVGSR